VADFLATADLLFSTPLMSTLDMYVLTGATGGLGSQVLKSILKLVPANQIIVSLYNTDSSASNYISSLGVTVRHGDYTSPETLKTAFVGGTKLLIVSSPSIHDMERFQQHKAAIDAAVEVGIQHIYYTSLAFSTDSVTAVMKAHLRTEAYLQSQNVKWTIIREGIYSESIALYLGFFDPTFPDEETVIEIPADGGIAWVSRPDLGAGTAKLLTLDDYTNQIVLLSGDKAYSVAETADLVGKIVNKKVITKLVSVDRYVEKLGKGKQGPEFAKMWAKTYHGLERGECATVDPLLQNLIGPLTPLEEVLRKMLLKKGETESTVDQYAK
jgi:uncharacterized protein YbjT (DUF2867 family)